jgi:hypothetical protein
MGNQEDKQYKYYPRVDQICDSNMLSEMDSNQTLNAVLMQVPNLYKTKFIPFLKHGVHFAEEDTLLTAYTKYANRLDISTI